MPGILYVVATPIGNLEDVTLRALRILREVSLVAAEDTRRTSRLLQHYSIPTATTSLHEHNERQKAPRLIERLRNGESIAVVSDAGTPAVSDPGARLVELAHESGISVQPVPGPSALTAIVSAAGLSAEAFTFLGFPPNRSHRRKMWLRDLRDHPFALVMYEAPHRIVQTLSDIAEELGQRRVTLGRELTKLHENLAVRPITEWISNPPPAQGEFVLVVSPPEPTASRKAETEDPDAIAAYFGRLIENINLDRREALRQTAKHFGVSARTVFDAVERHRKMVN